MAAIRSAMAGAFCTGLVPIFLRTPPSTTRTALLFVGGSRPAPGSTGERLLHPRRIIPKLACLDEQRRAAIGPFER